MSRYEVVHNDGDRPPHPILDKVVATADSGDKAREIQRKLHGQRAKGSSDYYGVREKK